MAKSLPSASLRISKPRLRLWEKWKKLIFELSFGIRTYHPSTSRPLVWLASVLVVLSHARDLRYLLVDLKVPNHLWLMNCFVSSRLLSISGFDSNVDDQELVPGYQWLQAKDVPFLIDGANWERLSGMDVLWSHRTDHLGTTLQQTIYFMRV